ncbi:hypothetical protein JTB14_008755 [Gonioctena quinquepunctata]|nr:hypothetical protein JTB14_008755 [Gonioctena quinquepunctata]
MKEKENEPLLSGKFSQTFTFQDAENELILSTIAPTAITGDTNIRETPIDFDFTFNDRMEDQSIEYVIPDEGNEVYSKEDIIPSSTIASKKKRTVASQRLHTSAVAATTLAEISRDTLDVQKQYYEKKLQLLERQVVAIEHLVEVFKVLARSKIKTKRKKNRNKLNMLEVTGGGPPLPPKLDITDELILSTIAPTAITDEGNEVYPKKILSLPQPLLQKERTVASQRLHTSAVAATTLAEISRDTLDVQKQYYEKTPIT